MLKIFRIATLVLVLPLLGCAGAGEPDPDELVSEEPREVTIELSEYAFASSEQVFEAGVPYRFILRNIGREPHEWAIVPRGAEDESTVFFEVEEDDLPPGATVTVEYTFPEPGEYDFACYMPGHHSGGMVLPIEVRPED